MRLCGTMESRHCVSTVVLTGSLHSTGCAILAGSEKGEGEGKDEEKGAEEAGEGDEGETEDAEKKTGKEENGEVAGEDEGKEAKDDKPGKTEKD